MRSKPQIDFGQQSTVITAACFVGLNSDETVPPALVFARTVWGDRAGDRERSEEGADLTKSFGTRINGLELKRSNTRKLGIA